LCSAAVSTTFCRSDSSSTNSGVTSNSAPIHIDTGSNNTGSDSLKRAKFRLDSISGVSDLAVVGAVVALHCAVVGAVVGAVGSDSNVTMCTHDPI
jgi:hypothetical protein